MRSERDFISLCVIVLITGLLLIHLIQCGKIKISQRIAVILLILFLGIVLGPTVFTRTVMPRKCKLIPFWSWKEVIFHHDMFLLQENLLNCILLVPMGCCRWLLDIKSNGELLFLLVF